MKMQQAIQAQLTAIKSKQQQVALNLKETVVNIQSSKRHILTSPHAESIPTLKETRIANQSDFLNIQNTILVSDVFSEFLPQVELLLDLLRKFKLPVLASLSISELYDEYLRNRQVIAKLLLVSKNTLNIEINHLDKIGNVIRQLDTRCLKLYSQQDRIPKTYQLKNLNLRLISDEELDRDRNLTKAGLIELATRRSHLKP